jgi:hypothetical protein
MLLLQGCGCATCYYAWGGQSSCSEPAPPGVKAGLGAFTGTYKGELAEMAGGEYIIINGRKCAGLVGVPSRVCDCSLA